MANKIKFTEEQLNEMVNLYLIELKSTRFIADKFNVDPEVITNRLKNSGVSIAKGSAYSIKYWIQRGLNEEEAIKHVKTLQPTNIEYWTSRGYSDKEAKDQTDGQKMCSLKGCIARFGEKEGLLKWNSREKLRSTCGKMGSANIEFWLKKGFNKEEAKIKQSERQTTFNLSKCIEKYGEEEGLKVWNERQIKWQESLFRNGKLKVGCSEISQKMFRELIKIYNLSDLNYIKFSEMGGELMIKDKRSFFRYDFTDLKNKKIIEYNGDLFHGNPKLYNADSFPNPFNKKLTAKEIWDRDEKKINLAKKEGFEVLIIWDSEYRSNPEVELNKCINFLKNNDE
jgi:hypothetical protein